MLEHIKIIKLTSVSSLFVLVKDKQFIADIVMKLKWLSDNLLKKKDIIQLDLTSHEYIRELDAHFTKDELRTLIHILG